MGFKWTEQVPKTKMKAAIPKCPICKTPAIHFDTTLLNDTGTMGVDHFKCPNGHTRPDECFCSVPANAERCGGPKDGCVLDVPWMKDKPRCPCPCPHCRGCSYDSLGPCAEGGQCMDRVECRICGNKYGCPNGDVCPYCCSKENVRVIYMVDADGKYIIIGGNYQVKKYCARCKKGAPLASASGFRPCSGD